MTFTSDSPALVDGDTNDAPDVFVRADLVPGDTNGLNDVFVTRR